MMMPAFPLCFERRTMGKLRGSAGWGGGQWFGGVRVWCTVLLFLCGFCSRTGGDVSIESTIFVTVAMTEDWGTTRIPSHIVSSSTSSPQEGSLSPSTPLPYMSRISSQPVGSEDVFTPSEILATTTAMVTEQYTSTLYDDPENSVSVETFSTAEGTIGAFTPGDIWATSTGAIIEQYTTTLYQNPNDTISVGKPVASEQSVLSASFDNSLTRSRSNFESTLQPSSLLISQRTYFVTEWSDVRETLLSTVLDNPPDSLQTNLPESARTNLPSRTKTVVPSTLFQSLPVSLQPTTAYLPDTVASPEGYSATLSLLDGTLIVTSDIVVTLLSTPLEVSETSSEDQLRRSTLYQPQSVIQGASLQPSATLEGDITVTRIELQLSSLIYFTETSDFLDPDVTTQMLSIGLTNPQSTLLSPSAKESTSPESLPVESTIILSSVVYVTESTEILQTLLPSTQLSNPLTSSILLPTFPSQTETTASTLLPLIDQSLQTSEGSSMAYSNPIEDVSTILIETVVATVTSDMNYTPWISPSFATPSSGTFMSSVPRSTDFFPSVESSNIRSVIFETEAITSEIFPSGLTPGLTLSVESVGSEMSTMFEEITTTEIMTDTLMITSTYDIMTSLMIDNSVLSTPVFEPTTWMTPVTTVPRRDSSPVSSSKSDSEVLWITSEVVETLVVSSDKLMASETFSYSRGPSDVSVSTSFAEVTSQTVLETVSVYETVTMESTLPIPTMLPSPVSFRPESQLTSTFGTSAQSMLVPVVTTAMPEELYSTVVEIITSDIAGTDDLLRSSKAIESFVPSSPTSFQSTGFFDISSLVYETLTINTEVIYSTKVQSLLPSPESTVQPELSTPFTPSCTCITPPTCTCLSPPPSLPPDLCSRIDCGSSMHVPGSTLSLDYTTPESFVFETVTITSVYETQTSDISTSLGTTMEMSHSRTYVDSSSLFPDSPDVSQVIPTSTISTSVLWTDIYEIITTEVFKYITTDLFDSAKLGTSTSEYQVSTLSPTVSKPSPQTESTLQWTMSEEMTSFPSIVMETSVLPINTTVVSYEMSTIMFTSDETSTVIPFTPSMRTAHPTASDEQVTTYSTMLFSEIATPSLYSVTPSLFYSTVIDLSTILVSDTIIDPTASDVQVTTGSTTPFSEIATTSLYSVTPSLFYSTVIDLSTILVSDTIIDPTESDVQVASSTTPFSEIATTSMYSVTPSLFYSTVVDFSTILVSDTIIDPTSSDGQFTPSSTTPFSEIIVTSFDSVTQSLFYSTVVDVSTILVSDTIIDPTASDGQVTSSTTPFSEIATTSLYSVTPSLLYSTVVDLSTILVSDTIIDPTASDGQVTSSTTPFSEIATTSLYSVTPSLLYSTVVDLSTILVSDTIINPTASDGQVTSSTTPFSEIATTSMYSVTPSLFYSTVVDFSTILVSDTIIDPTASDGQFTSSTTPFSEIIATSFDSVTQSLFYSTVVDLSTILVSDTIIDPTASDGQVTSSTTPFSEIATTSLYSVTPSLLHSTVVDLSTILVSDTIIDPTASDGQVTSSTTPFSEIATTSLYSVTPSLLYSTVVDLSTILVSDTIIDPTASDGQVTSSTTPFSEIATTSLYSVTPSLLYSTVVDLSTILVSDTIIDPTASDGQVTSSTTPFSEIATTSLYSVTPSLLYSTVVDLSTILVSDTIIDPTSSDGQFTPGSTTPFSEIIVTSFDSVTQSLFYSTVVDVSTILVSDTIIDPTASDGQVTSSTTPFSEIATTSLYSVTPSLLYSTVVDLSTILVSDTIIDPTASDGQVTSSTTPFSEIATSFDSVTQSLLYSTVVDLSTILVSDTIIDPTASDGQVTSSTTPFSEIATSFDSVTQSLLYSTVVDLSTILLSDTITDATSILPTTSEEFPTPSTPSFSSSLLPSLPTVTPILPSFTQTPGLDISSVLMYTTLKWESPYSRKSSQDLSSLVTEVSTIYDTVSSWSSLFMPSDYLTETLLTSEMVTFDPTDIFPTTISSTRDYLTLVMSSSDTFEPSSHTGTLGTVSTQVVVSITSIPISSMDTFMYTTMMDTITANTLITLSTATPTQVVDSSTSIPLLTPIESLQISSMDTFMYTTMLDTVITNTLITPSTTIEYSSSILATSLVNTLSSGVPDVSTSEIYDTVSLETTYIASSSVPSFTTMYLVTSTLDITPSRSTVVAATSIVPTVETLMDSTLLLETLSIVSPTSEVEESISRTISTGMPILSSLDSYATLILPRSYSSMISGSFETMTPVKTTDYVTSTMIDPSTVTPVSETRVVVTDDVTSQLVSSTYTLIEPSDIVSQVVTETVRFDSLVVSSGFPTPTLVVPSPSDSLTRESSSFLLSETPPLTSMPLFTTVSLSQAVGATSVMFSELTPMLTRSEVFLSSSMAPQGTTSIILSTTSQMVTSSIPPTLTPVTSTTELPIEVPEESQLTMDIKVPTSEDITAEEFSETLSNNLKILYVEAENNILQRRRRSNNEADAPPRNRLSHEWIFTRKRQTGASYRAMPNIELQDQYILNDEPRIDGLKKDSSAEVEWMFVSKQIGRTSPRIRRESMDRRKRQTDPSDEIEVPILMLSRSDDSDPETVTMTFYVMENDSFVLATDAAATFNTLTEGEISAQLGYAVRSMPHPVIPIPTTTPDYPYTIPPADQTDWLKVTMMVDAAIDETNATFQKQLRNDLEFLYVNGSGGSESNAARTRRDAEWTGDAGDGIMSGDRLIRERRAADPSSLNEVALESVNRPQADAEDVYVVFYVVDEGLVIPGAVALVPYQQYSLQELQDVIGYQVVSPGVTLYVSASPTGLAWWWWLIIAIIALLFILVIIIFIYYFCWAKKTVVKSLNKVDRSTSVELGFLRLEKQPKAKLVVMETALNEKASKRRTINGSASRDADQERPPDEAVQKRKKKKRSKKAQESTREYAKRGYLSDEDDQLFSHVDTHAATKPKTKKQTSTSRFQNAVHPEAERLPALKHRSLVAYSGTESDVSTEQLRMMRKVGVPKSWYTTHIDKDPDELRKDIAREKKRQKRKKEKKIHNQLTAEQMQKEFDAVLGGTNDKGIRNPTARQLHVNRTDRWKPKDTKRKSEIPESTGIVNESAVRLIRTRPLESAAPPVSNHEAIKREIEELLKRGPPKSVQGPLSKTTSVSQEEAKDLAEKKEREVRLRRKWAEERKKINRILDEAFDLSSTTFSNPSDQTNGDNPTTSNEQTSMREGAFNKDLEDSGYLRHRGYHGYGALDDSFLPGMMPGRLAMPPRSIPLYETSFGLDLSGEHLYDSIRRPPLEYEFLPSQMRSDGAAPAYGVSVSPVRTQRARVSPYPARDFMAADPYRSLNSSLSSSLQPMQITPRTHTNRIAGMGHMNGNKDEGQDVIRVQEENLSLQRLVAKQQRELDHALALIGQPNSRIGQSEKRNSKEGKIGSNGRKQRRVVPVNSSKPLSGPSTVSAWTDDHKAVERTSHPLTSTPNKEHLIKVKPRPSQREGSVILEHHIEKPGKGSIMNSKV